MRLKLITPPVVEPVSIDLAKAHCRVSVDDDDVLFGLYIKAVRRKGEALTGKQFVEAAYELTIDEWTAGGVIELPRPPLQSVTAITVIADDDIEAVIDPAEYEAVAEELGGFVRPVSEWPTGKAMVIEFKAGWPVNGTDPDFVATTPEDIQTWMLIRVAGLYEAPEPFVIARDVNELSSDLVDGLLDDHTIPVVV